MGTYVLPPTRYTVTTRMNKASSCVRPYIVSTIVWAKSKDSVHKPPFLKRKESRSGSNRGPSAYQPSALPLGHTGSHEVDNNNVSSAALQPVKITSSRRCTMSDLPKGIIQINYNGWWCLFPRLRGFGDNVRPFIPRLLFCFCRSGD